MTHHRAHYRPPLRDRLMTAFGEKGRLMTAFGWEGKLMTTIGQKVRLMTAFGQRVCGAIWQEQSYVFFNCKVSLF